MSLTRLFSEHPASLGETYPEHMRVSLSYAVPLTRAAAAAYVHALLPFLFTTTASGIVKRLYDRMTRRCSTCALGPEHRPDLFPDRFRDLSAKPARPAPREVMLSWDPVI